MASSEGRHEIETARKRLAAAKEQRSSTSKNVEQARAMLDAATKNMLHARSMDNAARNEVGEAEKCLRESEERWEVIDIDLSPENKKKRRKLSMEVIDVDDEEGNADEDSNNEEGDSEEDNTMY